MPGLTTSKWSQTRRLRRVSWVSHRADPAATSAARAMAMRVGRGPTPPGERLVSRATGGRGDVTKGLRTVGRRDRRGDRGGGQPESRGGRLAAKALEEDSPQRHKGHKASHK